MGNAVLYSEPLIRKHSPPALMIAAIPWSKHVIAMVIT